MAITAGLHNIPRWYFSNRTQNKSSIMDNEENIKINRGIELICEAAEAFLYTDEELRRDLPPEEAEEFIELRNSILAKAKPLGKSNFDFGDSDIELAAEDDSNYNDK